MSGWWQGRGMRTNLALGRGAVAANDDIVRESRRVKTVDASGEDAPSFTAGLTLLEPS
jgi:hypothetical protein